jgi:hypothetical protein
MSTTTYQYKDFNEFYPFYISQHSNQTCRRLHIIGTTLAILQLIRFLFISFTLMQFLLIPVIGYGFAWIGHYVFEKNKPATFKYPLYSLTGDFVMLYETYTGKRKFWVRKWRVNNDGILRGAAITFLLIKNIKTLLTN